MQRPVTLFTGQWADLPIERIAELTGAEVEITGWVRNKRVSKNIAFLEVNDGSGRQVEGRDEGDHALDAESHALLAVHPCFAPELTPHLDVIHAIAHITGGGIPGNLARVFAGSAEHLGARIDLDSWEPPAIFELIQRTGGVEDAEMYRAFNMGAGIIVALEAEDATALLKAQPQGWRIGEVVERAARDPPVIGLPE